MSEHTKVREPHVPLGGGGVLSLPSLWEDTDPDRRPAGTPG